MTPARVFGRIVSDAGAGIGEVAVTLTRGTTQLRATSSSDGTFSIAAAPGEWQLDIDLASLPAGYTMTAATQTVLLDRAAPRNASLAVHASRSISGIAPNGIRSIEVSDGRRVPVDEDGHFSIRSLAAGEITLRAGNVVKRVSLANGPAMVRDFTFADEVPATIATIASGELVVQMGVYRIRQNAIDIIARAKRAGIEASLVDSANLTIVRTGPFETREDASAVVQKLAGAGIEAIVMPK